MCQESCHRVAYCTTTRLIHSVSALPSLHLVLGLFPKQFTLILCCLTREARHYVNRKLLTHYWLYIHTVCEQFTRVILQDAMKEKQANKKSPFDVWSTTKRNVNESVVICSNSRGSFQFSRNSKHMLVLV